MEDAQRQRDDMIVVTVWLIMLTYALILNILVLIGIVRNNSMRGSTSYWFIISLAVCDIVMTIISLGHLVPATAFHGAFLEFHSIRNIFMIFVYDLFWYTAVLQLGLMACNRLVSIVYPMQYKVLFTPRNTYFIIAMLYVFGLSASLPSLFPCCHILWDSNFYITVYEPMDTWYKYVDMFVNSVSLIVMIISYTIIIYKVRESGKAMARYRLNIISKRNVCLDTTNSEMSRISSLVPVRNQASKKEIRLFVQFFVVSVVFLLTWTTWQWMPHIFDSKWAYFVMTSLFFINNSINPTVYLIFNTQLRHELQHLLFQRSITMGSTKGNHTAARSESDRTTEMKLGTVLMSSLRKKQQKLSICQGRRTTEPSEHSILDSVMYQPLSRPFSDHAIRFIADDEVFDV